jgi:hypothetical protein
MPLLVWKLVSGSKSLAIICFHALLNQPLAVSKEILVRESKFVSLKVKKLLGGQGKVAKLYARPVEAREPNMAR